LSFCKQHALRLRKHYHRIHFNSRDRIPQEKQVQLQQVSQPTPAHSQSATTPNLRRIEDKVLFLIAKFRRRKKSTRYPLWQNSTGKKEAQLNLTHYRKTNDIDEITTQGPRKKPLELTKELVEFYPERYWRKTR